MNYKKWKSVKNAHKREVSEYAIELNLYKRENKHLLSALSLEGHLSGAQVSKVMTFLGKPFKYWVALRQENENYKEILNNDREVEDRKDHIIARGKEALKEEISECLKGIDQAAYASREGWWATAASAESGASTLKEVMAAIDRFFPYTENTVTPEGK